MALVVVDYIECHCCGDVGAASYRRDGKFRDGQKLTCGCVGCVAIDEDDGAYVIADSCECWKRKNHNTRSRRSRGRP